MGKMLGQMSDVAEAAPQDLSGVEKLQRVGQGALAGGLKGIGNMQQPQQRGGGPQIQVMPQQPIDFSQLTRPKQNPFWGQ